MMRGINYTQANALIAQAINHARQNRLAPIAVVVLDSGGHIKASASEDGVGTLRFEIARGKANAALGMGFNSSQFTALLQAGVLSEAFSAALVGAANGNFNPNPGGTLITFDEKIIGAIGVSGASARDDHKITELALSSVFNIQP
jgi:uncharacterized protein GlcG (DUF336 family)